MGVGTGTSFETTGQLANVSLERRREIAALPPSRSAHTEQFGGLSLFREIEIAKPPRRAAPLSAAARVAFWNAERCKHVEASAALLARVGADVNLLCEMDSGMARSGQRHTAREVAGRLGQGYAFAVEYLELGHGDESERAAHAGEENASGVHGGAIASPHGLGRPALIRLDANGEWFDGANGERRVGGRIALAATIPVGGVRVAFASVHFESHGGPADRARQMRVLLAALDAYAGGAPVVIGGDFNTHSMSLQQLEDAAARGALVDADPDRLFDPVPHEPMFELAAAAGYDWRACNVLGVSTKRNHPGKPPAPPGKLDWFFTRGLAAEGAAVVPALDGATAISDHELIAVTISLQ